ncbi:hypothetical protein Syun_002183 [Stephania yunnanensis]|uniref:Uncharacterized protein n=1 Tax=Stephania yunnanensis TaxID=152371 RepID=A0AAP0LG60_9MAGN
MTDEYKELKKIERALHDAVDLYMNNSAPMGFLKMKMDALIERLKNHNGVIKSGKEDELEEIVVKAKTRAKAVKVKVKAMA